MAEHADPQAQLAEYESQLADVNEMISLDPNDESLVKLKDDLAELIALTQSEMPGKTTEGVGERDASNAAAVAAAAPVAEKLPPPPPLPTEDVSPVAGAVVSSDAAAAEETAEADAPTAAAAAAAAAPTKKKKKKSKSGVAATADKTFEVPDHLKPLPSDTDAERKRKNRTVKALKSKWRERKKEAEGIEKQKTWQDFVGKSNKKKKKGVGGGASSSSKRDRSIFATEEGVNARVGVISGTSGVRADMTEFDGKKRHKH